MPDTQPQNPKQITLEKLGRSVKRTFRSYITFDLAQDDETVAKKFCELFFLEGFDEAVSVNLANLSLTDNADKRIALSVRIPAHPIFNEVLPYHIAVAVIGYCPTATPNPIFIPERVFLTHGQADATAYESQSETVFRQLQSEQYPPRKPANLLSPEFTKSLPKYGVKTKDRLAGWLDFLSFKNKLIKHKSHGLRYLRWKLNEEKGQLHFWVVAENEQTLKKARSVFSRQNLHAFKTEVSTEAFRFILPKDASRVESAFSQIGQLANNGIKTIQSNHSDKFKIEACEEFRRKLKKEADENNRFNFDNAVFAEVFVDISEELSNRISQLEDDEKDGKSRDEKIQNLFKNMPKSGFLSISLVGDLALIDRHRRAVQNLQQNEGCYAPYLSSYLFDIENANVPSEIPEIAEWENKDLNDRQKSAVQKILAAPDICLIQGPPGTGKTTVIAEACLQFAKRGETVLLASQAHDALDNALSRLQNHPELRAIRLARNNNRITEEGKQFTGESVLSKHYQSLKNHVYQSHIKPFDELRTEVEQLREWKKRADYIAHDLTALQRELRENRGDLKNAEKILTRVRTDFERKEEAYRRHCQDVEAICQLIGVLKSEISNDVLSQLDFRLPETLYPLVETLSDLQAVKIEQTFTYSVFLAEPDNQTAILGSLLSRWQQVQTVLPKMKADLSRLQNHKNEQFTDTQTQLKMEKLKREIEEIADRLENEENDELSAQWRQKRKELRILKEKPSDGLNIETYEIFTDADRFTANPDLKTVKYPLIQRVQAIENLNEKIQALIESAITELNKQMQGYDLQKPNDEAVQNQQAEINRLTEQQNNIKERETAKREQGKEILAQGGFDKQADFVNTFEEQRDRLLALEADLEQMQSQNQDFMPLFKYWQEILSAPEKRAAADWNEMEKPFVESCNLVAITCNENERTLTDNDFDGFDVVIIDEVSKATPLELLLPLMRGKKAVLVGDHRQLPPIFNEADGLTFEDEVEQNEAQENKQHSDTDLTKDNLHKYEKMVTASLFKELFEQAPEKLRERLTIQFRMHPSIMRMINFFYENQLECGNPEAERPHGIEFKDLLSKQDHLLWIDTTDDENGKRFKIDDGVGNINRLEARMIAKTLVEMDRQLQAQGYGKGNKMKVGVVSFYQPQCRVIRDEIRKLNKSLQKSSGQAETQSDGKKKEKNYLKFSAIDVEINTVIRYQGKEKPIILLSLVKNNGGEMNQKFRAGRANIARFEFINVAMSRAQNLLLVFGARNMLENREVKLPRMDKKGFNKKMVYKNMFKYLEYQAETGGICNSKEFAKALSNTAQGRINHG